MLSLKAGLNFYLHYLISLHYFNQSNQTVLQWKLSILWCWIVST